MGVAREFNMNKLSIQQPVFEKFFYAYCTCILIPRLSSKCMQLRTMLKCMGSNVITCTWACNVLDDVHVSGIDAVVMKSTLSVYYCVNAYSEHVY